MPSLFAINAIPFLPMLILLITSFRVSYLYTPTTYKTVSPFSFISGQLIQGLKDAPQSLEQDFISLLQETDNLTVYSSTIFQNKLGIAIGMPMKENGETVLYVVGVYKYDTLNDVISALFIK